MERLSIYFLSILVCLSSACQQSKIPPVEGMNAQEITQWINHYEDARKQYYQGSRYKQEAFDVLQKLDPSNEFYFREQSVTHSKIGDYHIAFPLLEKSKEIDPKASLYYYAWLLVNLYHDYERGLEYLEEYDAFTPDQKDYAWGENVYQLKGLAQRQLKRYEEAIANFTLAIESEGDYPDTYSFVYRGICYWKTGQLNLALADFDTAIDSYDKCSMAFAYKGISLLELGNDQPEARKNLNHAIELLKQGYKLTDPYKEVVDEIHISMLEDYLKIL